MTEKLEIVIAGPLWPIQKLEKESQRAFTETLSDYHSQDRLTDYSSIDVIRKPSPFTLWESTENHIFQNGISTYLENLMPDTTNALIVVPEDFLDDGYSTGIDNYMQKMHEAMMEISTTFPVIGYSHFHGTKTIDNIPYVKRDTFNDQYDPKENLEILAQTTLDQIELKQEK